MSAGALTQVTTQSLGMFRRHLAFLFQSNYAAVPPQAGPPYEDMAFRIVNKEWNYARKHGFRCSFERGILHLFFNFKRTRYRR